jgi:hypothetical protein
MGGGGAQGLHQVGHPTLLREATWRNSPDAAPVTFPKNQAGNGPQ